MSVRVLVTDDSDLAAAHLRRLLEESPRIRVVGRMRNVHELTRSKAYAAAHVVVLDLMLPEQTGISIVREVSLTTPVVVVSEVGPDSPLAVEARARGAAAFFSKRALATDAGARAFRQAVLDAGARATSHPPARILAIVGSSGALRSYEALLPPLRGTSAAIAVVQHLPVDKAQLFTTCLGAMGVPASLAVAGEALVAGRIAVAPGAKHMTVDLSGRVRFMNGAPSDAHVPSASMLLASVARFGTRATLVILSGMGDDGASAVPGAIERGAQVLVQHPSECALPSMPRAALAASPAVRALGLVELSRALRTFAGHD